MTPKYFFAIAGLLVFTFAFGMINAVKFVLFLNKNHSRLYFKFQKPMLYNATCAERTLHWAFKTARKIIKALTTHVISSQKVPLVLHNGVVSFKILFIF